MIVNMERPISVLYPSVFHKWQLIHRTKKYFKYPWHKHLFSNVFRFDNWMIVIADYHILFYYNKEKVPNIREYLENIFNGKYLGVKCSNELTLNLNNVEEILI